MLQLQWQKVNACLLVTENEVLFFKKKLICLCSLFILYGKLCLVYTVTCINKLLFSGYIFIKMFVVHKLH